MTLEVDKKLAPGHGVLKLEDDTCTSHDNDTHVIISTPTWKCGTVVKKRGGFIEYHNVAKGVISAVGFDSSVKSKMSIDRELVIPMRCRYKSKIKVSVGNSIFAAIDQVKLKPDAVNPRHLQGHVEFLSEHSLLQSTKEMDRYRKAMGDRLHTGLIRVRMANDQHFTATLKIDSCSFVKHYYSKNAKTALKLVKEGYVIICYFRIQ